MGQKVKVDLSDTTSRGGKKSGKRPHYKEGDYAAKSVKVALGASQNENKRIEVTYRFTKGALKGKEIRDDLYLTEKSLWRVRQTLEAMGIKVPSKVVNLDIDKMKGKECALSIADDEYDGKTYSSVVDVYLLSELDADEDDDEEEDEDLDEDDDEEDEEEEEDDEEEDDEEDDNDDLEEVDLDDI